MTKEELDKFNLLGGIKQDINFLLTQNEQKIQNIEKNIGQTNVNLSTMDVQKQAIKNRSTLSKQQKYN